MIVLSSFLSSTLFGIDDEHQIEALRCAQLRAQSSSGCGSFDQGQDDGLGVDDDDDNEDNISLVLANLVRTNNLHVNNQRTKCIRKAQY